MTNKYNLYTFWGFSVEAGKILEWYKTENKLERFLRDALVESSHRIIRPGQTIPGLSQYTVFDTQDTS